MIIRSFFRKTTTRIYILLLSVIITVVGLLNSYNIYIEENIDKIYHASNLLIITTKEDNFENIINDERIDSVREALEFHPTESDRILENDPNINNPLTWESLAYYSYNTVLAFSDKNSNLKNNEILLGIDSVQYENSKSIIEKYKGKKIKTLFMEQEYEFIIKDVFDASLHPEFIISNKMFNALMTRKDSNIYTAKLKRLKDENDINKDYSKLKKYDDDTIRVGVSCNSYRDISCEKLNDYQTQLKGIRTITTLLYLAFIAMYIIISKNIINDLDINSKLEAILGYKKCELKINMFKRIFSMTIINYMLSIILSIALTSVLNERYNLDLVIFNLNYYIFTCIVMCLFNILLVIFMKPRFYLRKSK